MLISHRKKFIFTKTVKTGGTSVESYFEQFCMPEGEWTKSHARDEYINETGIIGYRGKLINECTYYNHMSAFKIKQLIGNEIWNSYFKFTIVRNPFDKLISAFYFFHKPNSTIKVGVKNLIKYPLLNKLFFNRMDIYEFRKWIKNGGKVIDRDKYITDGVECMDFFIKYESLLDDIKVVNFKLGIESNHIELPRFKIGNRNKEFKIRDFYDIKTEKIVRNIYDWEFLRFGYDMPEE